MGHDKRYRWYDYQELTQEGEHLKKCGLSVGAFNYRVLKQGTEDNLAVGVGWIS